ncbi:MAG: aspartate ammonia-lyase [Betaproteobacteria bacterium]|nr:aspartate ammonia-lyase [Betaproteobacteria bacterium]
MSDTTLSGLSIFADLTPGELKTLKTYIQKSSSKVGETIYSPGATRDRLRIIVSGRVELQAQLGSVDWDEKTTLYGPGQFMGEASLMKDGTLHQATATALTDVEFMLLRRESFLKMQSEQPALAAKIQHNIASYIFSRIQGAGNRGLLSSIYSSGKTRHEHDLLGEREVPAEAYFGVQTLRACENFNITGVTLRGFPSLIRALAEVKKAAALANRDLGLLSADICEPVCRACDEIIAGHWHEQFVVDVIQGGAGTSTNMNANEVIANRALEIAGFKKGDYKKIHPNNHVNLGQSTNDAYPTAVRVAILHALPTLIDALAELCGALAKKAGEFSSVVKMGRTQLQDAVPMTLGQEFEAFRVNLEEDIMRLQDAARLFLEVNLGGTAIGTGITAHPEYRAKALIHLNHVTGFKLVSSANLIEATPDTGSFVLFSGILKRLATKLSKICNDLRLLSSGPRCGLGEINLPPMQPGSSIMPGKVNPVIPEVVNQVAFQVIGNDLTITLAAEAGQLQLNVMEPVIVFNLFQSMQMLPRAIKTLSRLCVSGITANPEVCRRYVENSIGLVTALNPHIGYENSTRIAKEALETGRSVFDLVLEHKLLSREKLENLLRPENMLSNS